MRNLFSNELFGNKFEAVGQNLTGNNDTYLRLLWEISDDKIGRGKKGCFMLKEEDIENGLGI